MLPDFRAHVTKKVFPDTRFTNGELPEFWRAMRRLYDQRWQASEYTNLLQFAFQSPKWKDRYDWQIVGDYAHPIVSQASHYRGLGCKAPPPGTLQAAAPLTRALETDMGLFYPTARSPVSGDHQMRNYHVENWAEYTKRRDSDEWRAYLAERQHALQVYAKQRAYAVSMRDTCGQPVADSFAKCFEDMREPGGIICEWCRDAGLHEIPGIQSAGRRVRARQLRLGVPADPRSDALLEPWWYAIEGGSQNGTTAP
eukprot:4285889-Prymnesium_polylepis.1